MLSKLVLSSNQARGIAVENGPGVAGPRAGRTSMSTDDTDGSKSDVECPTCGRGDFASEVGMKTHHKKTHGESIAGGIVQCAQCGSEFRQVTQKLRTNAHHFCDRRCSAEWRKEHWVGEDSPAWKGGEISVECANCGDGLSRKRCEVKEHSRFFCDKKCQTGWQSKQRSAEDSPNYEKMVVECANCGGVVRRRPSIVERNDCLFCDGDCFYEWQSGEHHPAWSGGPVPYGAGFTEAKKERVRERQGRRCAGCDTHESELPMKLDTHHIQKARSFDDDEARNDDTILVGLCRQCHSVWEQMTPLRPQTEFFD